MSHHSTKYEPDGSITTWESPDGKHWRMTSQRYPEKACIAGAAVLPSGCTLDALPTKDVNTDEEAR